MSPSPAEACSPPPCWQSYLAPADGASIPANLPAITWRPSTGFGVSGEPDPARVALTGAGQVPILTPSPLENGDVLFVLDDALIEGQTYRLTDSTTCDESWEFVSPDNTFTATPIAPMPTSLGTITMTDKGIAPLLVATASGSCSASIEAHQVTMKLDLSQDALPWADALMFTTLVNGQPWAAAHSINNTNAPGQSWVGKAQEDKIFSHCDGGSDGDSFGLPPGLHEVAFEASLPGTDIVLSTTPLAVELSCGSNGEDEDAPSGGGCSIGRGNLPNHGSWVILLTLMAAVGLTRTRRRRTGKN